MGQKSNVVVTVLFATNWAYTFDEGDKNKHKTIVNINKGLFNDLYAIWAIAYWLFAKKSFMNTLGSKRLQNPNNFI